jgi:hypothetical protein
MLPDYYELRNIAINRKDYTVYNERFLENALPETPTYETSGIVPEKIVEMPEEAPEYPDWGPQQTEEAYVEEVPVTGSVTLPVEVESDDSSVAEESSGVVPPEVYFDHYLPGESLVEEQIPVEGEIPFEGETPFEGEIPFEGETPFEGESSVEGETPFEEQIPVEEAITTTTTTTRKPSHKKSPYHKMTKTTTTTTTTMPPLS